MGMRYIIWGLITLALAACSNPQATDPETTTETASSSERASPVTTEDRFAILALDCIHREYPNKISHVLQSADDARPPHELTPAFYGCFDWHSSVHGHWLLTRLLTVQSDSVYAAEIRAALAKSFTEDKMAGELNYYTAEGRGSFERPYGIAWYLQLVAELEESDDPQLREWRETLRPLEDAIVGKVRAWLPKLSYPVRLGTHNQTAFAFGLMLDYAHTVGNDAFANELAQKSLAFHRADVNCPLAYEPSGEDFLSPCLMEADLMRRVMPQQDFVVWLGYFLPQIPIDGSSDWLAPGIVLDASDGKLVHLDGVNLSRAWALEGIASALPADDPRVAALMAAHAVHRDAGIAAVSAEHYSGSHWLASFATYLTTKRGIANAGANE
ncbi:MAG: DUF2891 domain-containing protein [Alphaproteobacteria bacterium]|nr:DUF2891 domain-containing protein [Alphaproteobacteria bacterium]